MLRVPEFKIKFNYITRIKFKKTFDGLRRLGTNPMREFVLGGNLQEFLRWFRKETQRKLIDNYRKSGLRFRRGMKGIRGALTAAYKIGRDYAYIGIGNRRKLDRLRRPGSNVPYWIVLEYGTIKKNYPIRPKRAPFLIFKVSRNISHLYKTASREKECLLERITRRTTLVVTKEVIHPGVRPHLFFTKTRNWAEKMFAKYLGNVVEQYFKVIGLPVKGVKF